MWDEALVINTLYFKAFDKTLRNILKSEKEK